MPVLVALRPLTDREPRVALLLLERLHNRTSGKMLTLAPGEKSPPQLECHSDKSDSFPVWRDDKIGFIDSTGRFLAEPKRTEGAPTCATPVFIATRRACGGAVFR